MFYTKRLLYFFIGLLWQQSHAQEEFIAPAKLLARMPFRQLTGGVVIMQARFANFPDTLNFILDTGSGGISLDSTTTAYFGLKPTPSDKTIRGIAGIRKVGFLYDMGAGLCMMLSTDFIKDSALLGKKRKLFVKEAEGLGGKIDMGMTVVKEVKIGPFRFKNVPVYVFDDTYNITSYPYLGGLLGNDLLRRFNVILNYDRRDIYITPNKHYNDQFDYSYSGIELYYIDGEVVIGDVARGSPAEKAGVQEGDVVVSVNNVFSGNLNQLKLALQNTGERVRLIVRKGDGLKQYDFKVKSIMSRR